MPIAGRVARASPTAFRKCSTTAAISLARVRLQRRRKRIFRSSGASGASADCNAPSWSMSAARSAWPVVAQRSAQVARHPPCASRLHASFHLLRLAVTSQATAAMLKPQVHGCRPSRRFDQARWPRCHKAGKTVRLDVPEAAIDHLDTKRLRLRLRFRVYISTWRCSRITPHYRARALIRQLVIRITSSRVIARSEIEPGRRVGDDIGRRFGLAVFL